MGIAGLLRSVSSKLTHARPPHHRLIAMPGIHSRQTGFSRCSSRPFIAGSSYKDHTQNKEIVSNWYSANKSLLQLACFVMFGNMIYTMNEKRNAASREEIIQELFDEYEKMNGLFRDHHRSLERQHVEARELVNRSDGQTVQTSGNSKERGGGIEDV